jgi:hypothetical protein
MNLGLAYRVSVGRQRTGLRALWHEWMCPRGYGAAPQFTPTADRPQNCFSQIFSIRLTAGDRDAALGGRRARLVVTGQGPVSFEGFTRRSIRLALIITQILLERGEPPSRATTGLSQHMLA